MHTHQTNHNLLQTRRAETAALDTKIKDTLLLLTTTRAELLATPGTKFSDTTPQYPVSYSELLSYARRISKTTLPHTYREAPLFTAETPREGETNGSTPNAALANGQDGTGTEADKGAVTAANTPNKSGEDEHTTSLPPHFGAATSLNASAFTPWPHDMLLRRGALATIQQLQEKGEEIEGYDAEKGAKALEAKRRADAEEEEEMERAKAMRSAAQQGQAAAQAPGGKVESKPKKQFVVDEFDSDDSDE